VKKIDPRTAKVTWYWARMLDPYCVFPDDMPESCSGRVRFACGDDGLVFCGDLPEGVWAAIMDRLDREPPTEVEEPIPF
jgi:hypothetical protein